VFESNIDGISRRRAFVIAPIALGGFVAIVTRWGYSPAPSAANAEISVLEFDDAGHPLRPAVRRKVRRSDGAWRERLTPQQYWSTRRGTTDTPFTGTYFRLEAAGLFRCVCCENALFSSRNKFDSGTGWPSYSAPVATENVYTQDDDSLGLRRVEVLCRLCDAHLGHLFDDGPPPGGLRFCINESAMRFVAAAG
jgi:peptide-methionine (R)-S-oxide reductase